MWRWLAAAATMACATSAFAATGGALELVATIALANVKGRIDHFSADPAHHTIYVAALGNDTVEAIDTEARQARTVRGFGEPQGVLHLPEGKRLYVANGSADRLDILDAATLSVVKRIDGLDDADNVRYDAQARQVVVGYGNGALRFVDPVSGDSAGEIKLPGHPESFQLERRGPRLFVNVPSAHRVVVVDRARRTVVAQWPTPEAGGNFPMALDEDGRRLFVGARSPAALLVYDIDSGNVVGRLSIGGDTDDLYFDAQRKRVYAICGEGRVDVIRQETPDRYVRESSVETAPRARTGLFVSEESRLYVAAPARGSSPARILVYRVP